MCLIMWGGISEYSLFYRALLQKRSIILSILMWGGYLVGSLKLQVSSAQYSLFYRALLQLPLSREIFMCVIQQTEEIGLQIITTAKISNEFSRESAHISNMSCRESPKFHTNFRLSKQSPLHSKDLLYVSMKESDRSGGPNMSSVISSVSG